MTKDLRVVVDTNVVISGLLALKNSPSSKILAAIRHQTMILVTSPQIIEEIEEVLYRPRIVALTKITKEERKAFIDGLIARSDVTAGKQLATSVSRDSKDEKILACGREGKAEYIITGDQNLLEIATYEGIPIVTPREFIEKMGL